MLQTSAPIVVAGLGETGWSVIRYLKNKGYEIAVTDSRRTPPCLEKIKHTFPEIPVFLGQFHETLIHNAQQIILSPGISAKEPAVAVAIKKGITVIGDIELFAQQNKKPVLGITGSNGKTTVATILHQMVLTSGYRACACGNIGQPVLDALAINSDFYVIELSSFQLETTYSLAPLAAVIINMSPDHMDRYATFDDYIAAKQRIYNHCKHPIINLDQPEIWQARLSPQDCVGFTLKTPPPGQFGLQQQAGQWYLAKGELLLLPVKQLLLQGAHHYQNALAALAMGSTIDLPMESMLSVLKTFSGIEHRCQLIADKGGVRWFNDSKGTNVGATVAAIKTLAQQQQGRLFLIAGGDAKKADLSDLQLPVKNAVEHVMLFGQDADAIAAVIDGSTPYDKVDSLASAVAHAAALAKSGDTVLLSPACASFDMFDNYQHRGQTFIDLVNQLSE